MTTIWIWCWWMLRFRGTLLKLTWRLRISLARYLLWFCSEAHRGYILKIMFSLPILVCCSQTCKVAGNGFHDTHGVGQHYRGFSVDDWIVAWKQYQIIGEEVVVVSRLDITVYHDNSIAYRNTVTLSFDYLLLKNELGDSPFSAFFINRIVISMVRFNMFEPLKYFCGVVSEVHCTVPWFSKT